MSRFWHELLHAYQHKIVDAGKEPAFWLLIAFLVTFLVIRVVAHAIRAGRGPFRNVHIRGKHIHHLVPGIVLVLVSGYLATTSQLRSHRLLDAMVFGVGAALTLDEFALWLHLKDVYWEKQGRRSVDAVIVAATLGFLGLFSFDFWTDIGQAISRLFS